MNSPMDMFKIIYPKIVRKHPEWSEAQCINATKYAIDHPNWRSDKEKLKQLQGEFKPTQISFEDLMKRGAQYA